MFLNKIRNIFCVPDTKFVSATNVARAGKRGNICVGNNVSATMCLRLPGPLRSGTALSRTIISVKIVLTHHKSDRRRSVNDLQRVVACFITLFMSVLDTFLISGIFNHKFFEIQNTSLGKTSGNKIS